MSALAVALVGAAGVVLAALGAALLLPARLWLRASSRDGRVAIRARLMGGLLPWVTLHEGALPRLRAPAPGSAVWAGPTGQRRGRRLLRAAPELLRAVVTPARLERLSLDARIGLDDPAATGALFGALTPLVYGLGHAVAGGALRVEPVFSGPVFEGEVECILSVRPWRWVRPAGRILRILASPEPAPTAWRPA